MRDSRRPDKQRSIFGYLVCRNYDSPISEQRSHRCGLLGMEIQGQG